MTGKPSAEHEEPLQCPQTSHRAQLAYKSQKVQVNRTSHQVPRTQYQQKWHIHTRE